MALVIKIGRLMDSGAVEIDNRLSYLIFKTNHRHECLPIGILVSTFLLGQP